MSDKYGYIGIETLLNFCSNDKNHCVTPNDFMRMNRVKIDERPHGEWIPCFERLPEESLNSVIGWDRFRERCVFVQYMDGHFQITGKQESFDIIAWMPLPEPYKEEGDDSDRA